LSCLSDAISDRVSGSPFRRSIASASMSCARASSAFPEMAQRD
jgi:hypothetical protein